MRRSLPVVALALALVLTACEQGREPRPRGTDHTPITESPSAPISPVISPPGHPSRNCTLVIGFSVTEDWFRGGEFERQQGIRNGAWELLAPSGHDIELWANPSEPGFSEPIFSPCGRDPDRILFQVAAKDWRTLGPNQVVADLEASIANMRAHWPTASVVELIPIVGGPAAQPCPFPAAPGGIVDASGMNPMMKTAITEVADGSDVVVGPDPLLADCAQYRDDRGHLTEDGSRFIALELAHHYAT
jgi:hypothetical protein